MSRRSTPSDAARTSSTIRPNTRARIAAAVWCSPHAQATAIAKKSSAISSMLVPIASMIARPTR